MALRQKRPEVTTSGRPWLGSPLRDNDQAPYCHTRSILPILSMLHRISDASAELLHGLKDIVVWQ
jgi:hypothetical protein